MIAIQLENSRLNLHSQIYTCLTYDNSSQVTTINTVSDTQIIRVSDQKLRREYRSADSRIGAKLVPKALKIPPTRNNAETPCSEMAQKSRSSLSQRVKGRSRIKARDRLSRSLVNHLSRCLPNLTRIRADLLAACDITHSPLDTRSVREFRFLFFF